eukprot:COSAG04_NODE_12046_length_674_cov_0.622609_1_plen_139_part_10
MCKSSSLAGRAVTFSVAIWQWHVGCVKQVYDLVEVVLAALVFAVRNSRSASVAADWRRQCASVRAAFSVLIFVFKIQQHTWPMPPTNGGRGLWNPMVQQPPTHSPHPSPARFWSDVTATIRAPASGVAAGGSRRAGEQQ